MSFEYNIISQFSNIQVTPAKQSFSFLLIHNSLNDFKVIVW